MLSQSAENFIKIASKMPPDIVDAVNEEIYKEKDKTRPNLEFSQKQIESDSEAEKYIKTWVKGEYSIWSLECFLNCRLLALYRKTETAEAKRQDYSKCLEQLFSNQTFNERIHGCRKSGGLSDIKPPEVVFENYDEMADSLRHQCKEAKVSTDGVIDAMLQLLEDLGLHIMWAQILLGQIASPNRKQEKLIAGMLNPHVAIRVSHTQFIMPIIQPGIKAKEWDVLRKTLRPLLNNLEVKVGAEKILDVIRVDKDKGMSWSSMSKKYNIPIDNLKKNVRYAKQKEHTEPNWNIPYRLLGI